MKRLTLTVTILFFLAGCSGGMPDWFRHRDDYFSPDEYLVSEGWGSTPDAAIRSAALNMARIFQTHISVEETVLKRYQSLSDGKDFNEYIQEFSEETARLVSDQHLVNILFVEPFRNLKTRSFHTLAYMKKNETGAILIDRITRNQEQVEFYVRSAYSSKDPLTAYIYFNTAWLLTAYNTLMQEQIDLLMPGIRISPIYSFAQLEDLTRQAAGRITFSVRADPDPGHTLSSAIKKAVNAAGFSVEPSNAFLQVQAEHRIQPLDLHQDKLDFVSWELHWHLRDTEGNILLSGTGKDREAGLDIPGATLHAYENMAAFLERELGTELVRYFDTKLK
ncbi:MAG: hypothetical protein JXR21_03330 [Candidatus Marinimicrobia bacterium]|nr:hypothetical protein [Candidatus Neomarinimicrobiota bacterium]